MAWNFVVVGSKAVISSPFRNTYYLVSFDDKIFSCGGLNPAKSQFTSLPTDPVCAAEQQSGIYYFPGREQFADHPADWKGSALLYLRARRQSGIHLHLSPLVM